MNLDDFSVRTGEIVVVAGRTGRVGIRLGESRVCWPRCFLGDGGFEVDGRRRLLGVVGPEGR